MKLTNEKSEEIFSEYLSQQYIVVADASSVSRSRLKKNLTDLGAKQDYILSCGSYEEANEFIKKYKPKIVISEYMIGKKSGFDLLRENRLHGSHTEDALFILVTSSGAQSLVAKAAEEDVDAFVIKPYTLDSFKKTISTSALQKLYPSEYQQLINAGKNMMENGEVDAAKSTFYQAITKSNAPTLACFYAGKAEYDSNDAKKAEEDFQEGLGINKIHFKCLVGMYNLLMEKKEFEKSYDIAKKMAKFFPANPERLKTVLKLSIITNNISDIEFFYSLYLEIDERDNKLVEAMSAALIICAKYHFRKKKEEKAIDLMKKAVMTSKNDKKFIKFVVEYLVYYGQWGEIANMMKKFNSSDTTTDEFKICHFFSQCPSMDGVAIIQECQQMIQNNLISPVIHFLLIQKLYRQKRSPEAMRYVEEFKKKWPEKHYFLNDLELKEELTTEVLNVSA